MINFSVFTMIAFVWLPPVSYLTNVLQSLRRYLSTMELDPEHAEAHYNLGQSLAVFYREKGTKITAWNARTGRSRRVKNDKRY